MLPPPSDPRLSAAPPAATSAADPPLLPPGVLDRSYGLFVRPYRLLFDSPPRPISGTFVNPSTMAPSARSLDTAVASSRATDRSTGLPPEHASPATLITSLTTTGRPCALPSESPRAARSSASSAAVRHACGSAASTSALSPGLTASMRVRCASMTSRHDTARSDISRTSWWAGRWHRSVIVAHPEIGDWVIRSVRPKYVDRDVMDYKRV